MNFSPNLGKRRSIASLQTQSYAARHGGRHAGMTALSADLWQPKTCQWIDGEPRQRVFCSDPVREGSSYCEAHHRRCYRPALTAEAE